MLAENISSGAAVAAISTQDNMPTQGIYRSFHFSDFYMLSEFAIEEKPCKGRDGISEEAEIDDDEYHGKYLTMLAKGLYLPISYCRYCDDRHVERVKQ